MIISETVTINDKQFRKQYSDKGFYLNRNAVLYEEAIDEIGSTREYTETDILIQSEPETPETRLNRLELETEKNTADIAYISMMSNIDMGV